MTSGRRYFEEETMPIYLDVPYEEKNEAKALGARWNGDAKRWFVPDGRNVTPFRRWMPESIYLVIGSHACWRCGEDTEVAGFGIPYSLSEDEKDERSIEEFEEIGHHGIDTTGADRLSMTGSLGCIPTEIRGYLRWRCGYKVAYSRTERGEYLANTCRHCGALQGRFFLFEEVDSPFFIDSMERLEALEFLRVEVEGVYGAISSWGTNDDVIYEYAVAHHTDFPRRLVEGIYL